MCEVTNKLHLCSRSEPFWVSHAQGRFSGDAASIRRSCCHLRTLLTSLYLAQRFLHAHTLTDNMYRAMTSRQQSLAYFAYIAVPCTALPTCTHTYRQHVQSNDVKASVILFRHHCTWRGASYMYTHTNAHTHTHTYAHTHTYTHTHKHTHTHARTHARTHTHTTCTEE
jgi:hypothetical protein